MLNFSTCQSHFNSIIKFKGNNQRKCRLFVTQSTHDIVRRGMLGIYRCTFCFLQRNNQRALHILTNSPISHWVDTCSTLWCKAKQTQTDICRDSFHHNCHLPFKWLFVMWNVAEHVAMCRTSIAAPSLTPSNTVNSQLRCVILASELWRAGRWGAEAAVFMTVSRRSASPRSATCFTCQDWNLSAVTLQTNVL